MTYSARFAAILLLSSIAAPALADDWVPLGAQRNGTQVSLSSASLDRQHDKVSALVRFAPPAGAGWTSFVSIDCRAGALFARRLSGNANGSAKAHPTAADYHRIKQGSIGQSIAGALCPARAPVDISRTSVGGGPAMVMPYDPR
ncbi:hypothetical protein [Sphingomonas asaccharolytica]|uniref:hypothetical protein n=1 Tax=Sphingomonas asaccharolytica TaxID=40681 RepID=UPI000833226C|nr:hypothetical protein [Sphingomonas asaccharolytica]